jgi:sorting nexin-4
MLGDDPEDVFDSITWESPLDNGYTAPNASLPQRPGFKQSIEEGEESRGPHDPKWYGYLITHVKDPVKELAETKDAYVSYLVTAKVRTCPRLIPLLKSILIYSDELVHLLNP